MKARKPRKTRPKGGAVTEEHPKHLSSLLVWAVVFCDIGTSVYYVPGILYGQIGGLTPWLILGTTVGFILLALKYVEICWQNPEGGGVVTVTAKAFTPLWGCFGGMLITVDYFLTSAISAVSGMHYLGSVIPSLEGREVALSAAALVILACLNVIGIRESAMASLIMAAAALGVDLLVAALALAQVGPQEFFRVFHESLAQSKGASFGTLLVGFGGAWLAFSGLESISQLSPSMNLPIKSTAGRGMSMVVGSILLTSLPLSFFSVLLLPDSVKLHQSEQFISELGLMAGGFPAQALVVATASLLLLFAANTAIIGGYHVFMALAGQGYMPKILTARNERFKTPHFAILLATVVPLAVILATSGNMTTLGEMYAFGLLGAFVLSSVSVDVIRWRQGQRGFKFWVGILTTAMVMLAWGTNLFAKQLATIFGGSLVSLGMFVAVATHQQWFGDVFYRIPLVARLARRHIQEAELEADDVPGLIPLSEAEAMVKLYPSSTLVAVRGRNPGLIEAAMVQEKGHGGSAIYCLHVEERPGLFAGKANMRPDPDGIRCLQAAVQQAEAAGFTLIPVWTISYNASEAIARAASHLNAKTVMVGVSQRGALYHLLRGHVVAGLAKRLPEGCHLLLYG